jgi:hypothetical protein
LWPLDCWTAGAWHYSCFPTPLDGWTAGGCLLLGSHHFQEGQRVWPHAMLKLVLKDQHASLGRILTELLDCVFRQPAGAPDAQEYAAILWGLTGQSSIIQEIFESLMASCPGPVSMTAQMTHPVTLVRNSCCSTQGCHPLTAEQGKQEDPENPRTTIVSMKQWHPPQAGHC